MVGDDTKSVKSKTTSKSGKKKKKAAGINQEYSFDGDSARSTGTVVEEVKIEEPKSPVHIKREFGPSKKVTDMDEGVDKLRTQMDVWSQNRKSNAFYRILYEYDYVDGTNGKHISPTKRLID